MRRRERGSVLLYALAFALIAAILLNVALITATRVQNALVAQRLREEAVLEARGGLRWAAARLARGASLPIDRTDPDGALRVELEEGRIVATYSFGGPGAPQARVSAVWKSGALADWRED